MEMFLFKASLLSQWSFCVLTIVGLVYSIFSRKESNKQRIFTIIITLGLTCWAIYYLPDVLGITKQVVGIATEVEEVRYDRYRGGLKRSKLYFQITVTDSEGNETVLYDENILNYKIFAGTTPFVEGETYLFTYLPNSKNLVEFSPR